MRNNESNEPSRQRQLPAGAGSDPQTGRAGAHAGYQPSNDNAAGSQAELVLPYPVDQSNPASHLGDEGYRALRVRNGAYHQQAHHSVGVVVLPGIWAKIADFLPLQGRLSVINAHPTIRQNFAGRIMRDFEIQQEQFCQELIQLSKAGRFNSGLFWQSKLDEAIKLDYPKAIKLLLSNNKVKGLVVLREGGGRRQVYRPHCKDLKRAVRCGHVASINALLSGRVGMNVDEKSHGWMSDALIEAVVHRRTAVVLCLIEHEADVNRFTVNDGVSVTPVVLALERGDYVTADVLLKCGADINKDYFAFDSRFGNRLLNRAAYHNDLVLAKFLLRRGAVLGTCTLPAACREGYADMVGLLLANGANPNARIETLCDRRLLHHAAARGQVAIAKHLIAYGADVDRYASDEGRTPLQYAVQHEQLGLVKLLVVAGADVSKVRPHMRRFAPLVLAVSMGRQDILQALLATRNYLHGRGLNDALLLALRKRNVPAARSLIQAGANVENVLKLAGRALLPNLTAAGCGDLLKLLSESAVLDLDAQDAEGRTALYHAAASGCVVLVEWLLGQGASPHVVANNGLSPLCAARQNHNDTAVGKLEAHIASMRASCVGCALM